MYPYGQAPTPSAGGQENWGMFITQSFGGMYGQAAPPPQHLAGETLPASGWEGGLGGGGCPLYQPGQACIVTAAAAAPDQMFLLQPQPLVEWQQATAPIAPQAYQQYAVPAVSQPPAGYPSEAAAAPSAHGWTWPAQGAAAEPHTAYRPAAAAPSQLSAASSSSFVSMPSGSSAMSQMSTPQMSRSDPGFWALALQRHPRLEPRISEADSQVLQHLESIYYATEDGAEKCKLVFCFRPNPFLEDNSLRLEKVYVHKQGQAAHITGLSINWRSGMDVTRSAVRGPSRSAKLLDCGASFFEFFKAPVMSLRGGEGEEAKAAIEEDVCIAESIIEVLSKPEAYAAGDMRQSSTDAPQGLTPLVVRLMQHLRPIEGPPGAVQAFEAGKQAMMAAHYLDAYSQFSSALGWGLSSKALVEVLLARVAACLLLGKLEEALKDTKRALGVEGAGADYRHCCARGLAHEYGKNYRFAHERYKQALSFAAMHGRKDAVPHIQALIDRTDAAIKTRRETRSQRMKAYGGPLGEFFGSFVSAILPW